MTMALTSRRWRHRKRGTEYEVIGVGKMQSDHWAELSGPLVDTAPVDMREVVIYRNGDSLWVRPKEEFEDGRFEPIP